MGSFISQFSGTSEFSLLLLKTSPQLQSPLNNNQKLYFATVKVWLVNLSLPYPLVSNLVPIYVTHSRNLLHQLLSGQFGSTLALHSPNSEPWNRKDQVLLIPLHNMEKLLPQLPVPNFCHIILFLMYSFLILSFLETPCTFLLFVLSSRLLLNDQYWPIEKSLAPHWPKKNFPSVW